MSHHLHSLSPMFNSPIMRAKPCHPSSNASVVKNLQLLFDEQSALPLVKRSSHPDLQRISAQTVGRSPSLVPASATGTSFQLATLLDEQPKKICVIDARYPFEYAGGHIASAANIYTENDLRVFFTNLIDLPTPPPIVVFHCEFSSERGPRLCRLFRSLDRQHNMSNYPYLSFPSVYLLDGGYAEFYEHAFARQHCQPNGYVSMFEQQFSQELKVHRHAKKVSNGKVLPMRLIEQQGPIQFCMS